MKDDYKKLLNPNQKTTLTKKEFLLGIKFETLNTIDKYENIYLGKPISKDDLIGGLKKL